MWYSESAGNSAGLDVWFNKIWWQKFFDDPEVPSHISSSEKDLKVIFQGRKLSHFTQNLTLIPNAYFVLKNFVDKRTILPKFAFLVTIVYEYIEYICIFIDHFSFDRAETFRISWVIKDVSMVQIWDQTIKLKNNNRENKMFHLFWPGG
jgi:hypothetical protein